MNISEGFIKRPIGTTLLAIALLLIGIAAFPLLPVAPLPQVDFPTIQVSAQLPGGNPEIMASSVATPLERQFSLIAGLTQMTSQSYLGNTQITLQFDLARNIDGAALDVQTAINAASGQLPANLPSPPTYRKINPADRPIMILSVTSDTLPLTEVSDYSDNILAQQISQISGVGQVGINGQRKPSVRIQIDPAKIANIGLGLDDVRTQLQNYTVNAPKGTLDGPKRSVTVYDNDQIFDTKAWDNVIVAYKNGAPIRVRDIGTAVNGPENAKLAAFAFAGPASTHPEVGAGPAVLLAVNKQPGANVIDTVDLIKAAMPRLRAAIPPAVHVSILSDRTQTIRASVRDVEFTLVLTVFLVVAVIFMFLRNVAATLIPSVTVPLALMGTLAVMLVCGYSLDNLSLMALTIAVGFVVDDAIVMLENIYRHVEAGMTPMQAALKGASEIGFTIISISISLVAVFIPLLLMGGIIGRLFREFAITVTITIAVSVLVSLTLTPMLCSRYLKHEGNQHGRIFLAFEAGFDWLQARYERGLKFVLRHQFPTLLSFLFTLALTGVMFVLIPKGFFPQQDTGFIFGAAQSAQDISFGDMLTKDRIMADIIRKDPAVDGFGFALGGSTYNYSSFFITLKSRDDGRTDDADAVIARLRKALSGVEGAQMFLQSGQDINVGGRLSRTQYQYTLTDADITELSEWAPKIQALLNKTPGLVDVASDQQGDAPAVNLTIDRDRASSFGISPSLIDNTIYDAIGQRQIAQYFTQLNSYHVVLEVPPALQNDPSLFDRIYITAPTTGKQVPLSSFVHIDNTKTSFLSIAHQGQFPAVTISFNLRPGTSLGQAVDAIKKAVGEAHPPGGLQETFQGNAQAFQASLSSQPYLILAALVAVYIVLGLLYESFIHPLTILSTLPSAGVGALAILMLGGFDLSVIALIGIILLIGIVKKNGIMMIDFALTAEREQGMSSEESIYQACLLRFRPITMTTMAALLAGLPLMLGTGTGSELRRPLGFAMVGGLLVSQALTLFTTPVIYIYLDRLSHWLQNRRKPRPGDASRGSGHAVGHGAGPSGHAIEPQPNA
jgi:HAE1 family hydrophobic/amphiphilic exporter-1